MNRNTLVVSANGGVGSAVTRALLNAGDHVIATVSRRHKVASFQQDFPECSKVFALDLSEADGIAAALKDTLDELPSLDAVIVCGAISPFSPAEFTALDMARNTMEINVFSHLAIYQVVMPALRTSKGRIIFTGSLSGRVATPMMAAYVASKFALEGLVDTMRQEASEWGVDVVLLQPGSIDTPIIKNGSDSLARDITNLSEEQNKLYGKLYRQIEYRLNSALDAGGIMQPSVVANAALEALDANKPKTRYRLGADAEYLIEASQTMQDRDIDNIILDIYRSAPDQP